VKVKESKEKKRSKEKRKSKKIRSEEEEKSDKIWQKKECRFPDSVERKMITAFGF
jgi:hypothetical protein